MDNNNNKIDNNNNKIMKSENKPKKNKIKCIICNKKHLIINQCKCGGLFCLKHRLPELHNCNYDFKNDDLNKVELYESCEFKKINKI